MLNLARIEEKIGYAFKDKRYLLAAFTHSSYKNVHGGEDNERLEYLGDAVLQLLVSEAQFLSGDESEGEMTKARQALVRQASLKAAVEAMGIESELLCCGGKDNVGDKTVASLYESVLAAVYLDGGLEAARSFLRRHPLPLTDDNFKGRLQEFLQKRGKAYPVYAFEKHGADNAPTFVCSVSAEGKTATGTGATKRAAEQAAAKALLEVLSQS